MSESEGSDNVIKFFCEDKLSENESILDLYGDVNKFDDPSRILAYGIVVGKISVYKSIINYINKKNERIYRK